MTDFYALDLLTHPIPDEYTPWSSVDDYHKINARLRDGYNPKWDALFPDKNGEPGHNGPDLYALKGRPVFNPFSKPTEIWFAGTSSGNPRAGRFVELIIPVTGGDLTGRFLHLDTILVKKGQTIKAGQQIGTVGDSGPAEGQPGYINSPHCHIDIAFYPGGMNRTKGMLAQPRLELDLRIFLQRAEEGGAGGAPLEPVMWPTRLRLGDRGPEVRVAKALLVALGVRRKVGGEKFTTGFDQKVRDFQRRAGLTVDGVIGPATRDAINRLLNLEG